MVCKDDKELLDELVGRTQGSTGCGNSSLHATADLLLVGDSMRKEPDEAKCRKDMMLMSM